MHGIIFIFLKKNNLLCKTYSLQFILWFSENNGFQVWDTSKVQSEPVRYYLSRKHSKTNGILSEKTKESA